MLAEAIFQLEGTPGGGVTDLEELLPGYPGIGLTWIDSGRQLLIVADDPDLVDAPTIVALAASHGLALRQVPAAARGPDVLA